jgi:hypothetical protein
VNAAAPFQLQDLEELDQLLERAEAVIAMEDVADGATQPGFVGLRHDVDNVIAPAVAMAQWEAERGYRSTFFVLHTAPYWHEKETLRLALAMIAECGHEIGLHINAITEAITTGRDPLDIAQDAVDELRSYHHDIRGVVAHGDQACYEHHFINDELFTESRRPGYGAADRVVGGIKLQPISRSELGFDYDPNWLPRAEYLSDSGGHWSQPFETVSAGFPFEGQLHCLIHPDWWAEAFQPIKAAAA